MPKGNFTAAVVRLLTGVRLQPDEVATGQSIFYANHSSHLDFVVVWASLPASARRLTSAAAAADYWGKSRFRRWLACDLFQAVLIPREGITKENNPLDVMAAALEAGRSILIFPEGTRGLDGEVSGFKAGIYHLAKRFPAVPLVPVYLDSLNRILPKGSLLPVPIIAQAHFRPAVAFSEGEAKADFLTKCRTALLAETTHRDSSYG